MRTAFWKKHILNFGTSRGTSRGRIDTKPSWFIVLHDSAIGAYGIGECGLLPGLSIDDKDGYEAILTSVVDAWQSNNPTPELSGWPSIRFGFETARLHLQNGSFSKIFPSPFSEGQVGIPINGLVWMNEYSLMRAEVNQKLEGGFSCIKIKIGAVDFADELALIRHIRKKYSAADVTIRVDANGAFEPKEALGKLEALAKFDLHSIEQPICAGQWREMEEICKNSPLPIALDEELIGLNSSNERGQMMEAIKPQAVILKPSLIGGFAVCDEWVELCKKKDAFWWATSALESNVGLNAIAQYTASKSPTIPQGLGTGLLYTNNFDSPLEIRGEEIFYNPARKWNIPFLK